MRIAIAAVSGSLILALTPALAQAPSSTPAQNTPITVALGQSPAPASAGFYIAQDKGYFSAQGLSVQLANAKSPDEAVIAVVSGQSDIAAVDFSSALWNIATAGGLRVIAGTWRQQSGYTVTALAVGAKAYDAGLKTAKDLAGKKLAIDQLGSAAELEVLSLARADKFDFASVELVPLQSDDAEATALKAGTADAAILPATSALALQEAGNAHIIAWMGDRAPLLAGGVLVRADAITSQHDTLVKFLGAYLKGAADYAQALEKLDQVGNIVKGPNADQILALLAKDTGETQDQLLQSVPYIDPQGAVSAAEITQQIADWQGIGLVDKSVKPQGLVDTSILQAATGK